MQDNGRCDGRRITILLAEDDPGDQELTRRALQSDLFGTELRIVEDGEEALEYLRREGAYADPESSPRPDLMLLDLNMPRMNGRELLKTLKDDPDLDRIPVCVLTTSEQEADILRSYDLGCNSYIQKPVEMDQFINAVRKLGQILVRRGNASLGHHAVNREHAIPILLEKVHDNDETRPTRNAISRSRPKQQGGQSALHR